MKVGDRVVCIKKGAWSGIPSNDPKYGDECIIIYVGDILGTVYLKLKGYNDKYSITRFRKIEPNFTNALTRKLAEDFIEEDSKVIETERERVLNLNAEF